MAFQGPNTQFKFTARSQREALQDLGYNNIQIYALMRTFKLQKHRHVFTITALDTATTIGNKYTTSNGSVFTVCIPAAVGDTTLFCSCENGLPTDASSTLTYVTGSDGVLGTHQATIAYSAVASGPAALGPFVARQDPADSINSES